MAEINKTIRNIDVLAMAIAYNAPTELGKQVGVTQESIKEIVLEDLKLMTHRQKDFKVVELLKLASFSDN